MAKQDINSLIEAKGKEVEEKFKVYQDRKDEFEKSKIPVRDAKASWQSAISDLEDLKKQQVL